MNVREWYKLQGVSGYRCMSARSCVCTCTLAWKDLVVYKNSICLRLDWEDTDILSAGVFLITSYISRIMGTIGETTGLNSFSNRAGEP